MKILPFDRFWLISPHDPADLQRRLGRAVKDAPIYRFRKPSAPFFGRSLEDGFKMVSATPRHFAFAPMIAGQYEPHHSGTRIHVTQRLSHLVWLSIIIAGVTLLYLVFSPDREYQSEVLTREMAFVQKYDVYLLAIYCASLPSAFVLIFWRSANKTKALLKDILDAEEDAASF